MDLTFSCNERNFRGIEFVVGNFFFVCPFCFDAMITTGEFAHGPRPRSLKKDEDDFGRSLNLSLTSKEEGEMRIFLFLSHIE
jgi:hypothetical protein